MSEPYAVVPLSPLRKIIAVRMSEAKRTIPHFRLSAEIDMDALLAARVRANDSRPDAKITINDCILKACASTLLEHQGLNIQLHGNDIHQYREADISVVVAVAGGLSTPVVRQANRKSIWWIADEVRSLSVRASAGQLRMDEIMGGTFSISNLGAHGVDQFDAIINLPQCAILAVAAIRPKVVATSRGATRIANMLTATLSVDHRAIDGVTAAAFMKTLRGNLEQPETLFEAVDHA